MTDTTVLMNGTTTGTITTMAAPVRASCVVGEERVYKPAPPEIIATLTSFYPRKVVRRDEAAVKITFYVLVMLLAIVGNSLVIFIVTASRKMKTPTNVLLLNLAISDFLICVLCMWVHLGDSITQEWPFGLVICKTSMFAQVTLITNSVLTLTAISVERFFAIVFPWRRTWTLKMTACIIFCIWLIACGIASPQLATRHLLERRFRDHHVIRCQEDWPQVYLNDACETWRPSWVVYHVFVAIVMFFVPIAVMIVSYTIICFSLLTRKAPGGHTASESHARSKRKVVRLLIILVVVFILCWTPAHVIELKTYLKTYFDRDYEASATASYIALFVAYLNSALNPILYAGFNENFRRGYQEVFSCSCVKHVSGRVRPESRRSPSRTHNSAQVSKLASHQPPSPGPGPPPTIFTAAPQASGCDNDGHKNGAANCCHLLQVKSCPLAAPPLTISGTTVMNTVT